MKRNVLAPVLIVSFSVALGLAVCGQEKTDSADPVQPAVLLFEPALFAAPGTVSFPAWISGVGYEGGDVGGATSAWRVAESAPAGVGKLWIDLDQSVLDENLALSVVADRLSQSDMIVQLWDGENRVVALDLFGNITAAALESRTDTFVVPMWKYPAASRIVLRRISGATAIYGVALIPVVLEKDIGTNIVEALAFARLLGDRLSPENELVRRVRVITGARPKAEPRLQPGSEVVVAPRRAVVKEPERVAPVAARGSPRWEEGCPFPVACGMLAATVFEGRIYAMGGYNGRWNSHVYAYDPQRPEQGWMSLSNMPMGRACLAAVTVGGRIYSIGGQGTQNDGAAVFAYDPKRPEQGWADVSPLPVPLLRHAAAVVRERIYVMGGIGPSGVQSAVYEYDAQNPGKGWRFVNDLPEALGSLTATVLEGKIYVIGGITAAGFSSRVYVFDPAMPGEGWVRAADLPVPRCLVGAVTVGTRIYAIGGFNASQAAIRTVYMYDAVRPGEGWLSVGDLPDVRGEAPAVLVGGKSYLVSGAVAPCSYRPSVLVGSFGAE